MAAEEAKMVPAEPPTTGADVVENNKPSISIQKPSDDTKPVARAAENSEKACEEKFDVDRDVVLARVAMEKKDALIKAWEESQISKIDNRAQTKLAAIGAWENSKKAEVEAKLKKMEEKLEKKKAKYTEKMKNKIALLHKIAEEKRAITEAKRGESLLKAEELAAKYRSTGATTPKKLLRWFSS